MYCKQLPVHPVNDKEEEAIEMGFNACVERMKARHPKEDLLEALIELEAAHDEAARGCEDAYDEWLWDYCYEIAYFNLICREMAPLFAPKKEVA